MQQPEDTKDRLRSLVKTWKTAKTQSGLLAPKGQSGISHLGLEAVSLGELSVKRRGKPSPWLKALSAVSSQQAADDGAPPAPAAVSATPGGSMDSGL